MADLAAAAFFFCLSGTLIFVNLDRQRWLAVTLALVVAGCGSYLTSQRTVYENDDILNYHEIYLALGNGDWSRVDDLGGGLEVVLPLILRAMHPFMGDLGVSGLLFWLTFVGVSAAIAIFAWLIPQIGDGRHFSLRLAFSIAFMSFFGASHTTRQFYAGVVMLPLLALWPSARTTLWLGVIASLTHVTSVFYVVVLRLCRSPLGLSLLVLFSIGLIVEAEPLLSAYFELAPNLIQSKLTILTLQGMDNNDISNMPDLVRLGLLSAVVLGSQIMKPDSVPVWTRRFVYLGFVINFLLVDVAFLGSRVNHMLLNVGYGFILMMSTRGSLTVSHMVALVGSLYQTHLLLGYD